MEYIGGLVSAPKRIRLVEFVDEVLPPSLFPSLSLCSQEKALTLQIPKSASGKILRRILVDKERKRVADQAGGSGSQ